jgi:hypothetical protein
LGRLLWAASLILLIVVLVLAVLVALGLLSRVAMWIRIEVEEV